MPHCPLGAALGHGGRPGPAAEISTPAFEFISPSSLALPSSPLLLLYSARWCPHSQRMRAAYEAAASRAGLDGAARAAVVECAGAEPVCAALCPLGVPTIHLILGATNGSSAIGNRSLPLHALGAAPAAEYAGDADAPQIERWVRNKLADAQHGRLGGTRRPLSAPRGQLEAANSTLVRAPAVWATGSASSGPALRGRQTRWPSTDAFVVPAAADSSAAAEPPPRPATPPRLLSPRSPLPRVASLWDVQRPRLGPGARFSAQPWPRAPAGHGGGRPIAPDDDPWPCAFCNVDMLGMSRVVSTCGDAPDHALRPLPRMC